MAQNNYSLKIELNASKEEVWNTITDFPSYSDWNTVLIMENNNALEIGEKFKVTIIDKKGKKSKFKAKTLAKDTFRSFSARQIMLGKWFFSATHHFILEPINEHETRFIQTWEFSGILFKLFKKSIYKQLERFNQMNVDLKDHL